MEEGDRPHPRAHRAAEGPPHARLAAMTPSARAARARALALEAGFDLAGVASADPPPPLAFFAQWIGRGHAGAMDYLTAQVEKRSSIRTAFPWARSVVSVGLQYDTP